MKKDAGPKKKKENLVIDFIKSKRDAYKEPQRAGTPKGEPIGLSAKKYFASLMFGCFNSTLKDVHKSYGKEHGVSYGLLKKWKTEKLFKETMQSHQKELALKIYQHIESQVIEDWKNFNDYLEGKIDEEPGPITYNLTTGSPSIINTAVVEELDKLNVAYIKLMDPKGINDTFIKHYLITEVDRFSAHCLGDTTYGASDGIDVARFVVKNMKELVESKRTFTKGEQRQLIASLGAIEGCLLHLKKERK